MTPVQKHEKLPKKDWGQRMLSMFLRLHQSHQTDSHQEQLVGKSKRRWHSNAIVAIFWKDCRELRPVWMTLWLLFSFVWVSTAIFTSGSEFAGTGFPVLTAIGTTITTFVLLAAAISYAREVDEKHYDFLRRFPVTQCQLLYGKVLAIMLSTAILIMLTTITGYLFSFFDAITLQEDVVRTVSLFTIASCESMCIGLFVSTRSRDTLHAIVTSFLLFLLCEVFLGQFFSVNLASWLGRVFVPTESLFLPEALTLRFLFLAGLASHFFGTLKWYRIHDGSIKNIGTPPAFSKGDQSQVPAEAATHRKIHQPFIALMNQTMQSPRKLHPVFFIISFTCLAILYFALPVVFSRSNWFPETEAFSMIPTITICALFWMIMNLIVQYLVLSASTIFTSDIREEKTGLLTIHGVSPAKMWLSRILVNGIHALITLCAAFVVLLPIVFPEIFRWGENNYYTFFLGSSTQSYLLSIPAKAYILGTAAFIMQLYCSGAVATATFRSRIISWMAIMILTAVPIMFLFVLDPVPWEAVPFAAILLWSIMLVVSFRNFTRHMRKRKISLTSPVFMAFIIVPWLLYFWFLPWISAWSIHREPAFFVPDEKIMNDPYNPSFGEDKIALQLERDTLPWARNANTFEALDAWGVSKNNVLDTKGPWGIPKEISLSSNNFAHDIANNLESSWRNHIRLWNENRRACCGYSTNFEARLLVNMYFFCEYFSDVDLEMLINLLHRIPDERPPIKEQAKRIWQLAVRASRVQDSHLQYPLAPLFYTDQNAVRLQFERWLWNQNQAVAEWGTLQEQYYLKGNRLADPTKKLKQLRKRITLWSNRLKRITDLPLPCVVFSSKGEHLHSIVSVENLRRTLLIQLAILRYYYRHNDFPPQLNSLVDEGFLQKVPEPIQIDPGPGKHIPFYYSQKNTSATKNSEREESQSHCQQFSSGSDFDGKVTNEKEPKISQYTLLITTENGTAFCDSTPNRSVFTEVPNELAILHWILSGGAPLKIVSQNPILYNPHTGEFLDLKKPNHKMEIKCNSH